MNRPALPALIATALALSACDKGQFKFADIVPVITGTAAYAACAAFYRGRNPATVRALCAGVGGLVGLGLRQYLNEQETKQLADATRQSLETGKVQTVRTERGTTIKTEVVPAAPALTQRRTAPPLQRSQPQPVTGAARPSQTPSPGTASQPQPQPQPQPQQSPPAQVATSQEKECQTVLQTVITATNEKHEERVTACQENGAWVV